MKNRFRTFCFAASLIALASPVAASEPAPPFNPTEHPEYRLIPSNPPMWWIQTPPEQVQDPEMGYRTRSNSKIRHILRTKDSYIWNITMNFDQRGNRITPQDHLERRKKFLVFSGCSFVNGTGLNDDETLPYYMAKELGDFHVYNFGIGGSAPNMMLARIEGHELQDAVQEKQGLFVYVTMFPHIGRANVFYQESGWMAGTPNYEYGKDGKLHRAGSVRSAHPWRMRFYSWLTRLQEKFFPSWEFNMPRLRQSHFQYLCDLVAKSAEEVNARFPGSKFVVINHPLHSMDPRGIQCMKDRGLTVLEPRIEERAEYKFQNEGHPTPLFNRVFSKRIAEELAPYLK